MTMDYLCAVGAIAEGRENDMRITVDKAACLVVDYQEKLVPAMAGKEALMENSVKLIKGLRLLGVPITITGQYTRGLGLNLPEIFQAAGTEEYVDKLTFSAYEAEEVKAALGGRAEDAGPTAVIVCGIEAHVCVLQTCIDLKEAGYQPVLVTDCIASRKEADKETALRRAQQEGVLLTTSEAILFELTRKAGSEVFKEISRLVK